MRAPIIALGSLIVAALVVAAFVVAAPGCNTDEDSKAKSFADHSSGGADVLRGEDGRVLAVRGRFETPGGGSAEERAKAFVDTFRAPLGLAAGVEIGQASVSGSTIQTVAFELTAGGHPIEGGGLTVRLTPQEVFFVLVSAPPSLPELPEPTLDAAAATARASELFSGGEVSGEPGLVVYAPELLRHGTEAPRLAWRVAMQLAFDEGGVSAPVIFVDAVDGSELGRLEQVRRARKREIYDMSSCVFESMITGCRDLIYNEAGLTAGATDWPEAAKAWAFAGDGCDFLKRAFAEEETCNPLVVYVNSKSDTAAQRAGDLFFGEGKLTTDPDEGYRSFMHELGHALVDKRTKELTYSGESGAVHECIADVVSMLASKPATWVVLAGDPYERNLSDPGAAPANPTTYSERRTGFEDEGWVHYNSVILSHAIWLATVQGLEVRGDVVEGMGYEGMEAILSELLSGYLGNYVTLRQAAASMIDACMVHPMFRDVFGLPTTNLSFRDCGLLVNALAEVGLADPDEDLDGWPDNADNCKTKPNPYQEDSNNNDIGDACETGTKPPSDDRTPYPDQPDASPDCPASILTGLAEDPNWQLDGTWGPRVTTAAQASTLAEEHFYEFHCSYRSSVKTDQFQSYQLFWQPRDPAVYKTAEWWFCNPDNKPLGSNDVILISTKKRARVELGNGVNTMTVDQRRALLSDMLAAAEAVALPCP